jgi:hypothetical protein
VVAIAAINTCTLTSTGRSAKSALVDTAAICAAASVKMLGDVSSLLLLLVLQLLKQINHQTAIMLRYKTT